MSIIYLAGGCFWGVEEYFSRIPGVEDSVSGYANGNTEETEYKLLYKTDHAETVKVTYDPEKVSLREILLHYFMIIDPTSINKQGEDTGRQYRTGIYYTDDKDLEVIESIMEDIQKKYDEKIQVEVSTLKHFILAEEYHQDYLKKNPGGYCHIDLNRASDPLEV